MVRIEPTTLNSLALADEFVALTGFGSFGDW